MPRPHLIYCASALLLFAILSYAAVTGKSATFDEPSHVMSSCVAIRHGDFRVEVDHPPLWKYFAAIPTLGGPPAVDNVDTDAFRRIPGQLESVWSWCVPTLYQTPGNDPTRILARSRFMMLLIAVGLGAMITRFAYRAAGPLAACVAVTPFSLDPNFLAHGAIVKDDVAITLVATGLAYVLWRASVSLTWWRVAGIAVLCACAATTKLTGILAIPVVVVTLVARALLPAPWPAPTGSLTSRPRRVLGVAVVCVACGMVTYVGVWGVYLFRFNPAPDPSVHIDTRAILLRAAINDARAKAAASPVARAVDPGDVAAWAPSRGVQIALFALDHRLLPEAYVHGFLYTYAASRFRTGYLLGQIYGTGKWYYFPITFAVKTPLATLAVFLACAGACLLPRVRRSLPNDLTLWISLAATVLLFGGAVASSGLNIGIRHLLPIFPALYVACAILIVRVLPHPSTRRSVLFTLFGVALAAESFAAYPNYIPFFNAAAGGSRGGFRILSDSNLDWGQDLPLLADWQKRNPNRTLHLAYFGTADPAYYRLHYSPLPGGFPFEPLPGPLPTTGVLAVSATILQGAWQSNQDLYAPLRLRRPTRILGGSLYLFDLDAR